jgi:PAS domain S-box-containing protein
LEKALYEGGYSSKILDVVPAGILLIDPTDHKVVYANQSALRKIGRSKEQVVGAVCHKFICPAEIGKCPITDLGQTVDNAERAILNQNGELVPILKTAVSTEIEGRRYLIESFLDIREHKRTEDALRESEKRFREMTDMLPETVFELDMNGRLTFLNRTEVKMIGYDDEDLKKGLSAFQVISPENHDALRANIGRILGGGSSPGYEYAIIRKDGSRFPAMAYASPIIKEGKTVGLRGVVVDITERKRNEESLRKSEERYRRLFEGAPVSLWEEDFSEVKKHFDELRASGIKDLGRYFTEHPEEVAKCANMVKILNVNEVTLGLYEAKSAEEMLGELRRVLSNEPQVEFREELVALSEGKTRFTSEFDNRTLKGGMKHVSLILTVVPGYEETLGKVLVSIIDLTERKQMEEELRAAREQLEYVLATNPAVVFLEKPVPDLSDTLSTYVSESATFILGFDPKNFIGESGLEFWRSRIHPDDLVRYSAEIPSLWRDGHHTFEYRFLHSDGVYRWISEQYRVLYDADGRILNVVTVAVDVTERKEIEEKLAKTERLAVIGQIAAMVGHDLRNPLQAMTSALYLAKKLIETEDRGRAVELLNKLDEEVNYMEKIVSDLQSYSGPVGVELIEIDLPALIKEVLSNVRVPENVETTTVAEGASNVKADPVLMRRVMTNLVNNAIQAMPDGGKVTLTYTRGPNMFSVAVRDTGVGIAPENLTSIFTPFFTKKAKGQGLGLAVCKRLVEAQGGTIDVKSSLGQGSTFIVTIPSKERSEPTFHQGRSR